MNEGSTKPVEVSYKSKWTILAAVMLGSIMGPLDASIVNTVLPSITGFFHTEISIAQWVPTVYLLTISCLILLYGRLGDMIGYKRIYLYGLAAFTVTSIFCAFSQSIWMLISFRALQGLAAGMMMAVSFAIITAAFPPKERGKAMGISAVGISIGLAAGPTLGGVITEHLSWRYIFLVNVPIGAAALIWGLRVIPESVKRAGQRLDLLGALTAFIFLLSLLLYANRGESWGWAAPESLVLLAVAVLFGVAFIIIEKKSPQPMLNLSLFTNRIFSFANLSSLLSYMAVYAIIFLTPFYLMFVLHYNVGKVGWVMASTPLATLFVAPVSGIVSDRIGSRGLAFFGMSISALGMYLMSELNLSSGSFDVIWRMAIFGLGVGIFQSPNNSTVMGNVPQGYLGVASGVLAAMRNVGMVLGIAIVGVVLYNVAPVASSGQPGSFNSSEVAEFLSGLQWGYVAGAGMAAAAALASLGAIGGKGKQG